MSRLAATGRLRRIQLATLLASAALLSLVVWSVITSESPSPLPVSGLWEGSGTAYDSTGGGLNHVAILLQLTEDDVGRVSGVGQDCNDAGQRDTFGVSGFASGASVTLVISGAPLHGRASRSGLALAGSANGVTLQLALHKGMASEFESSCAALGPQSTPTVP